MSRSQGAANGGWQQRHPAAAEPDPRTGRPTQPPRSAQPAGYPPQAPPYAEPQQAAPPAYSGQQGYYYPQAAPAAPQGRQGLSSFEPTQPPQQAHDFENYPATQPPYAPPQQRAAGRPQAAETAHPAYRQQPAQQYAPPANPLADLRAPQYDQWPAQAPAQDPHGYDLGGYMPAAAPGLQVDPLQQAAWAIPANDYGDPQHLQGYAAQGYEQPHQHAGALEPTYGHEEAGEYETEEPRRGSWTMRIVGAIVVAIGLGYGLAQAYKMVLGTTPDGAPPIVQSDSAPAKEKPLDPGGKQFSHTDSKVLGRLGDGGSEQGGLSQSDADSNGARKVTTLTVGRDGSIAPPEPPAAPEVQPNSSVSVPGLTVVDAFGSAAREPAPQQQAAAPASPPAEPAKSAEAAPEQPAAAAPAKRVNVKSTKVIPAATASLPEESASQPAAPPAAKKPVKTAAADASAPAPAASGSSGANGYVVVLASVPASGNSRLDALKRFADMQQQYGAVLANKTPDVQEANLGDKGMYHRLLVGPPGSRAQASALCGELKTAGYKNCWVTAY
jgi:hypothetical protein